MITAADLYNHRESADFKSVLHNYLYQNCDNPQKVKVYNPVLGRFETREDIPCGRCWHCCQSKSADWVTRMFLHNEDWPYRYFITLTYRPIYSLENDVDSFLFNYIADTLPIYDDENSMSTAAYHPCCLSRAHLRNYFKRLRASLPKQQISLFAVGEYGKSWGRPHYHAIVWSKEPIGEQAFSDAWSLSCVRINNELKPYRGQKSGERVSVVIGDVDVCNLNKPRYSIKSTGGHAGTLSDVFKYVAKYVNKYENYVSNEQNDSKNAKNTIFGVKSLRLSKIFRTFAPEILNNRYLYECKQLKSFSLDDKELHESCDPLYRYSRSKLCKRLAPFSVCSCVNAIAKEYYIRNSECLSKGLFKPSLPNGIPCRFPNYFTRKIREEKCRFRVCKVCVGNVGKKTILRSSLSYGNLPLLSHALNSLSADVKNSLSFDSLIGQMSFKRGRFADKNQIPCTVMFWDFKTRKYYKYDNFLNCFSAYVRKNNCFTLTADSLSLTDFVNDYNLAFNELIKIYNKTNYTRMFNASCLSAVRSLENFQSTYLSVRSEMYDSLALHQKLYYAKRKTYAKNI